MKFGSPRGQSARRAITIVGGGQAGLMLAVGLQRTGHDVRLIQDRSASAIANGRIMSGQCLFATALRLEESLGLDLWRIQAPPIESLRVETLSPRTFERMTLVNEPFDAPANSVDQRLKFPAWMDLFERIGGTLEIQSADIDLLERYTLESELVIVTTGKGPLARLFPVRTNWSPFERPMRNVSLVYLRNGSHPRYDPTLTSIGLPEMGDIIRFPALTKAGHCEVLVFEALIDGLLDVGCPNMCAEELFATMQAALSRVVPEEAERFVSACVTDENAGLTGGITPIVRFAVGALPSGRRVIGVGDAVVLNDPLLGQGANNAAKVAALFLDAILRRDKQPFDNEWLETLATTAWERVRATTIWTNISLQRANWYTAARLSRAQGISDSANWLARAFDDPNAILPFVLGEPAA